VFRCRAEQSLWLRRADLALHLQLLRRVTASAWVPWRSTLGPTQSHGERTLHVKRYEVGPANTARVDPDLGAMQMVHSASQ
jgi:hypothetical protein